MEQTDQRTIHVAGVQYDNRQTIISRMTGDEKVVVRPEPTNQFDSNALAVFIQFANTKPAALGPAKLYQVGYVPRQLAARLAKHLDGKDAFGKVVEVVKPAIPGMHYGLVIAIEVDA